MIETLKGLAFLVLLVVFYPLPVTVLATALIRLALGWGRRIHLALAGAGAALPAYVVLFMKAGLFGAILPGFAPYALIGLSLAGAAFWVLAARRGGMGHFWLEPLVMAGATVYLLLAVPNWIAH